MLYYLRKKRKSHFPGFRLWATHKCLQAGKGFLYEVLVLIKSFIFIFSFLLCLFCGNVWVRWVCQQVLFARYKFKIIVWMAFWAILVYLKCWLYGSAIWIICKTITATKSPAFSCTFIFHKSKNNSIGKLLFSFLFSFLNPLL